MDNWIATVGTHKHKTLMQQFKDCGYDRRQFKVKDLRNDFMGIIGSEKPWEVAVGQQIASALVSGGGDYSTNGSIISFLGEKIVNAFTS